jgi:hypothetical protein
LARPAASHGAPLGGGLSATDRDSGAPACLPFVPPLPDSSRPRRHRHDVLTIRLALCLVVQLHLSWRGMAGVLALLAGWTGCTPPAFSTARSWLLRLGLFVLRRAVPAAVGGWVLLVDNTIQLGQRKALVVLGLPLAALRRTGFTLALRDVTVLALEVLEQSTAEKVHEVLQGVARRVGAIAQVVSDHGADILQGIRRLQQDKPGLVATYDVRHKLACLLKAELEPDARWRAFLRHGSATLVKLRQTAGHFLAPPPLRHKARYMNVAAHIRWAERLLAWQQAPDWAGLAAQLGQTAEQARRWWAERLGWLGDFRQEVAQYGALLGVAELAQQQVQQEGISRHSACRFWLSCHGALRPWDGRVQRFAAAVRSWLGAEGKQIPAGQSWLGSSDVIESLFGKYKALAERGPGQEFEANLLLLPLLGAALSNAEIQQGLQAVSGEQVQQWVEQNLGQTPAARKRRLLGTAAQQGADSEGPKVA